jgi:hypothetical protein
MMPPDEESPDRQIWATSSRHENDLPVPLSEPIAEAAFGVLQDAPVRLPGGDRWTLDSAFCNNLPPGNAVLPLRARRG